ncbi:MAG: PIN domain protein [Ignavibacteriae bacterium]|nr:PIN domain protein [Ignavibacteriota bacterium]
MKQRIYIDTSVIGGYFDDEFKEATQRLFLRFENGELNFVVSDLLELELINAPQHVRQLLLRYPKGTFERVEITEEVVRLADMYITENVVGKTSIEDCRHIALATVNNVDVLVSWNFKHIVNLDRIRGYNAVNVKHGYPMIEIRSPKEIINYEN